MRFVGLLTVMGILSVAGCMAAGTLSMEAKRYARIVELSNQLMFDWYHSGEYRSFGNIPSQYHPAEIKAMSPSRLYEDNVNLVIVLDETEQIESGMYVLIPASSYDPTTEADRFVKLDPVRSRAMGEVDGKVFLYTLAK